MTPEQIATLKSDMASGPLAAQIAPLMALGPVVDTLYDFPAGTPQTDPALPHLGQNVVKYMIDNVERTFVGLSPVPDDVFALLSDAEKAGLIVSHVQHSQDDAISALYNAVGNETLSLQYASKNDVLSVVELAVMAIPTKDAATQQKWATLGPMLISLLGAADGGIEQSKATGLQAAVTDGLITADQAASPWTRKCSHAETLFGAGWTMTATHIGEARNS